MAGYIGTQAVSVNTTSATISDDLAVGDDALITGTLTTTAATVFNGGFTANDGSTITTADNLPQLTLISTDADANKGPVLDLFRNSANPAVNDVMGQIKFVGEDDGGNQVNYARINTEVESPANGNEIGRFNIITLDNVGGSAAEHERLTVTGTESVFNEDGADIDFRVESDDNVNMIKVDGGDDRVGIGVAPVQGTLTIKASGNSFATAALILEDNDSTSRSYLTHVNGSLAISNDASADQIILSSGNLTISDGNLVVGTAGHGIDFSAQTVTSASGASTSAELLDHYEEGTFTAVLTAETSAPSSAVSATCDYVRIGKVIHLFMRFSNANTSGASGTMIITGLPYASANTVEQQAATPMMHNLTVSEKYVTAYISGNRTTINFLNIRNNAAWTNVAINASTGVYLNFNISYRVA